MRTIILERYYLTNDVERATLNIQADLSDNRILWLREQGYICDFKVVVVHPANQYPLGYKYDGQVICHVPDEIATAYALLFSHLHFEWGQYKFIE